MGRANRQFTEDDLNDLTTGDQIAVNEKLKQGTVAHAFGVSTRTIHAWNLPTNDDGRTYDLATCVAARLTGDSSDEAKQLFEAKLLKEREQGRKLHIANQKQLGTLCDIGELVECLALFSEHMAKAGEKLRDTFGDESRVLLNHGIEAAISDVTQRIEKHQAAIAANES